MTSQKIEQEDLFSIDHLLIQYGIFKSLDRQTREKFLLSLEKKFVEGGEELIKPGDVGETLYVILQGRLRLYSKNKEIFADLSKGEIVGEMSLLLKSPSTFTIKAIRDTVLLKIPPPAFNYLEKHHPHEVLEFAKKALGRLRTITRPILPGEKASTIALIPAGNSRLETFYEKFAHTLNTQDSVIVIKESDYKAKWDRSHNNHEIVEWLQNCEENHTYVVAIGDAQNSDWTKHIIRSSDRILFVAEAGKDEALNESEQYLFQSSKTIESYLDLVLFHPCGSFIQNTAAWLKNRPVNIHHHLENGNPAHMARLARFIKGNAFGVVLSGGGARALCHLGVLKALEEMKIPIDFIAGTSMGALIAAGYAAFGLNKSIKISENFVSRYFQMPTLPIEAFLTGKLESKLFKETWGDKRIEDLWMLFFCVATDLSENKLKLFDTKEIWKALRASISVPGLFPPVYTDEGDILVDGGVLNNLPVDVMRQHINGGVILAVNCNPKSGKRYSRNTTDYFRSGWTLLFDKLNPFRKEPQYHLSLLSVIMRSINASTIQHQIAMEKMADYNLNLETIKIGLNNYKNFEKAIEAGYKEAKAKLSHVLEGKYH